MSNATLKFNIPEAKIKEAIGTDYQLDKFRCEVDYVRRKCFKSYKIMFREDIFPVSIVDASLVEHKQEPSIPQKMFLMAKVTRKYPNPRIIETSVGRVNVGKYKGQLRIGQVIKVKDGSVYLKW